MEQKKLCRSMSDKAICGVCSGFARYFDIDPIVIRLAVVLLALAGTIGVWFYIIAAIIMPKDTELYARSAYKYDPQTGRPLYSDGSNIYENYAGGSCGSADCAQAAEEQPQAQDAGWTQAQQDAGWTQAQDVEFKAEPYTAEEQTAEGFAGPKEASAEDAASDAAAQSFEQNTQKAQSFEQNTQKAQSFEQNTKQNPYENFQAYNTQTRQPEKKSGSRNRNTGILLIIIGVVILAKIVLPRINIWIPISIASIFFGIYLLCRKN